MDGFSDSAFSFTKGVQKTSDRAVNFSGTNKEWNFAFATKSGILKGGAKYRATFKVRVAGGFDIDKKFECVVRNVKGYVSWGDIAFVNSYATMGDFPNIDMRFDVPQDGDNIRWFFSQRV